MTAANDIAARGEEIQLLVAADSIAQSIKRAMDFARDFSSDREHLNELIDLSGSFRRLDRRERQGLLDFEEAERHRRKLVHQLLALLDAIEEALALQMVAA